MKVKVQKIMKTTEILRKTDVPKLGLVAYKMPHAVTYRHRKHHVTRWTTWTRRKKTQVL